ncbi:MAG: ATP-binding protein [Oligoflexia bacterium]|nr:ATP-binding protein [Oligoflexia bacterium]
MKFTLLNKDNWFKIFKGKFTKARSEDIFDIKTYRLLAITGTIFYPLWSIFFIYFVPGNIDPIKLRLIISSIMLIMVVTSFTSKFVKRNYKYLFILSLWLITAHYFYIWKLNHLSIEYSLGLLVTVCAISAAFPSKNSLLVYCAFMTSATCYLVFSEPVEAFSRSILLLGVVTIFSIYVVAFLSHLRTLNELATSEKRFKLLTEHLRVGVILHDPQGQIIEANPSGLKMLGTDNAQSIKGKALSSLLAIVNEEGEEITQDDRPMAKVLKTNLPIYNCNIGVKRPQGLNWLKIDIDPIYDSENKTVGIITSMLDITEQKAAEDELHHSRAQSQNQARLASLGEMAGGIAHEINNPLAIIELKLDQLKSRIEDKDFDNAYAVQTIETVLKTSHRIAAIIKGLRYFSRDGTNDPLSVVTLKSIIESTLVLCTERFTHNNIKLIVPDLANDLTIECSPVQIHQVLLNLLNNAFDAVEKRSEKWVEIKLQDCGKEIKLIVKDSGLGIPASVELKMFYPFFTTKEIGKGTGLGLSISKGIILRHNGKLEIDHTQKNTTFIITLPKAQPLPQTSAA